MLVGQGLKRLRTFTGTKGDAWESIASRMREAKSEASTPCVYKFPSHPVRASVIMVTSGCIPAFRDPFEELWQAWTVLNNQLCEIDFLNFGVGIRYFDCEENQRLD